MSYITRYHTAVFDNHASNEQKIGLLQNKSPGFMAREIGIYLAAGIILVAATCKLMHQQLTYMQNLLRKEVEKYQKINLIAELQQDLFLPAKIIPMNSQDKKGIKIIRKNQTSIDWQFKPNVQRGISGSWTKMYRGQIEYKFVHQQIYIDFID
jgi:hypothetical protein